VRNQNLTTSRRGWGGGCEKTRVAPRGGKAEKLKTKCTEGGKKRRGRPPSLQFSKKKRHRIDP